MNKTDSIAHKTTQTPAEVNQNSAGTVLRDLLVTTVSHYTNNPLGQCVMVSPAQDLLIFQMRTEMNDHRKILGKGAHTWQALNIVFREIGRACKTTIDLRLLKPVGRIEEPLVDGRDESDQFNAEPISNTLRALVVSMVPVDTNVSIQAQSMAGITAFNVVSSLPVGGSDVIDALRTLVDAFGGKARRKFYLTFQ